MVLVTGATGFIGGHLVRALLGNGIAVRILVRDRARASGLVGLGATLAPGDITDKASLEQAVQGVDTVIHLVGIIQETRHASFQGIHVEGTRRLLDAARSAGVKHFVYQSALGTRHNAKSEYHRTKWAAEELVRESGIPSTILRPSLIYGPGDLFTLRLADMIRLSPVLPVIGSGRSKVQPLYIDDAVGCLVKSAADASYRNEFYELGGPEQLTYEAVTVAIADALGIKRPVLHMPLFFMRPAARLFESVLSKPPLTTEQLILLQEDTICSMQDIREAFGIEPVRFREGLARFIRPV